MKPEEQRQEIKNLIAYYEDRGWDWLDIVAYHGAKFTGRWPVPRPERKNVGRHRGKQIASR